MTIEIRPVAADSPRRRICICTTYERSSGRYFSACMAHEKAVDPYQSCGHTDREGCNGHGDF